MAATSKNISSASLPSTIEQGGIYLQDRLSGECAGGSNSTSSSIE